MEEVERNQVVQRLLNGDEQDVAARQTSELQVLAGAPFSVAGFIMPAFSKAFTVCSLLTEVICSRHISFKYKFLKHSKKA